MACPSDDDLSSYLAGRVTEGDATAIGAHIGQCGSCEALVEVLGGTVAPSLGRDETLAAGPRAQRLHEGADAAVGDSVGGYVLLRRVGAGGMGVVWEAYDPDLDRTVAIKLMRDAAEHLRIRFDQEVRITARLQHPSIVNIVEAGSWRGEPYYVMKMVRGDSLDAKLRATATVSGRLSMLPSIIAVVDAIAYAHGARVIHRDLKPENILVGEFGEAVVIDWGLAKQLSTRSSAPSLRPNASSPEGTTAGSVIGTPSYMPPEQARGEAVDARADVYALGAILYFLLSGHRPYADATAGTAVIAAVVAGPPAPLPPGTPFELATIVHKAMARDPSERYATGKELADDLKRFQMGQLVGSHTYSPGELLARWIRRHRGAVGVAAAALVVLATAGTLAVRRVVDERAQATAAQARAEMQRADVEKLLTFMLGDLRRELSPLGKVALLETVATQAVAYFEGPRAESGDQQVRVRAQVALGDVLMSTNRTELALDRYRQAESVARTQLLVSPTDRVRRRSVAEVASKIGLAHWQQGNVPAAVESLREQQQILLALAAEDPGDERDRDLAASYDALGSMLRDQGDTDAALAQFEAGLALHEAIIVRAPDDLESQRSLGLTLQKLGSLLARRGDLAGAIATLKRSIGIMTEVVSGAPAALEYARDLAIVHSRLGKALRGRGDREGALVEHERALELFRTNARREPANARYQADLANELSFVASVVKDSSLAEALVYCREARAIRDVLVIADPTNTENKTNLLASAQQTALILLALRRAPEALDEAATAVRIGKELVAHDPTRIDWKSNLLLCHAAYADVLEALGKVDDAIAAQREGLAIARAVVAADSTQVEWLENVADRHEAIADMLWANHRADAIAEYRAALALYQQLARDAPENPQFANQIAAITKRLAAQ